MKPAPFDYHAPRSVEEAVELLAAHGDDAKVLAGGQSLVPAMNFRLARPAVLVDINRIAELDFCTTTDGALRIGALARHARFERAVTQGPLGDLLADVVRYIAHLPIRVRGTFAGSLAHADPAAEWCVVATTLDAEIRARGPGGERSIEAAAFFRSILTTALRPDELITEVRLPALGPDWRFGFAEFSRRAGDFALSMALAALRLDGGRIVEARVGVGGAERPAAADQGGRASARRHGARFRGAGRSRSDRRRNGRAIRGSARLDRVSPRSRPCDDEAGAGAGARAVSWIGRPIPASRGSRAGHRARPLRRRPRGRRCGAPLRAQPDRLRSHREDQPPQRGHRAHGDRSRRRAADPATAAPARLRGHRAAGPCGGSGPLRRRADRCGDRRLGGGGRGSGRAGGGRPRARRCRGRCRRGARPGRAAGPSAGRRQRPGRRADRHRRGRRVRARRRGRRDRDPLAAPVRAAAGGAWRARRLRCGHRSGDAHRLGADAAHAAHRACRRARHRGGGSARGGAGRGRRVRPEDGARAGIRRGGLGGPTFAPRGRVDRGPQRESHGLVPQPRSPLLHPWRVRRRGASARGRCRSQVQRRGVFLLSRDLRRRAAHGHGGAAGPVRLPGLCRARPRRHDQHLPDGALSRRLPAGDHARHGAADGLRRRALRPRPGGDPAA